LASRPVPAIPVAAVHWMDDCAGVWAAWQVMLLAGTIDAPESGREDGASRTLAGIRHNALAIAMAHSGTGLVIVDFLCSRGGYQGWLGFEL
jgi:hypothetical protein